MNVDNIERCKELFEKIGHNMYLEADESDDED